ncbi:MAG: BNR-4 repeat-containing protein [Hyphomicrobiaceae bacterium]|nr:BNR-4 repeat-containing protein [Hyphomicrobiaceae bacterium]
MALAGPRLLLENVAWCWWTRPRATRIGDKVFLAALDHEGGMVAARYDQSDGSLERVRLARFEDDDHNNPALLVRDGRPALWFYSRHDAEEGLRYRVSQKPLDIGSWDKERILTFGGSTTYAEVHESRGEIHLFTRVDETRWAWRRSNDWAETWTEPSDFLAFDTDQQVYMATALMQDGTTLRVGVSGHPKDFEKKPVHDLYACLVDLDTGVVSLPSSGRIIGNLRSGEGLPLDYRDLELVSRTPIDRTINVLDVSTAPEFEIGFVSKFRSDDETRDAQYEVAALRNGTWQVEPITAAGRKFGYIHAGLYVGGLAFPDRGASGQLYLTREEAGLWHFEFWRRRDDGTWTATALIEPGRTRLARPWAIENPDPGLGAVALRIKHYADDSYFGSAADLIGIPVPRELNR